MADVYLGKGLEEPCSPYRRAYVFGADLNAVYADGWNCAARIVDATTLFDLSLLEKNKEVCAALFVDYNIRAEAIIKSTWYRARDMKQLYQLRWVIPDPRLYGFVSWDWYYVYSYIGYVDWEINENGGYYVEIINENTKTARTIAFKVTGIPVPVKPPESSTFFSDIAQYFESISWYPIVGPIFSTIAAAFVFADQWLRWIQEQLEKILDWPTIKTLLEGQYDILTKPIDIITDTVKPLIEKFTTLDELKKLFSIITETKETIWAYIKSQSVATWSILAETRDTLWTWLENNKLGTWFDAQILKAKSTILGFVTAEFGWLTAQWFSFLSASWSSVRDSFAWLITKLLEIAEAQMDSYKDKLWDILEKFVEKL